MEASITASFASAGVQKMLPSTPIQSLEGIVGQGGSETAEREVITSPIASPAFASSADAQSVLG